MSWVAMTIEVPDLLSSTNRRNRRCAKLGSTLPVGSSARSNCGRAITARAIAARCFSPPERIGGSASIGSPRSAPVQKLDDFRAIARFILAKYAQRQRHVLIGRQMIEQPEVLEHDADAAAQCR